MIDMDPKQKESDDPDLMLSEAESSRLQLILFGSKDSVTYTTELPWDMKQVEKDREHGLTFGEFTWEAMKEKDVPQQPSKPDKENVVNGGPGKLDAPNTNVPPPGMMHLFRHPVSMGHHGQGIGPHGQGVGPHGQALPVYPMYPRYPGHPIVPPGIIPTAHGLIQAGMPMMAHRPHGGIVIPPPAITTVGPPSVQNFQSDTNLDTNRPRRNKKKRPPDYYEKAAQFEKQQFGSESNQPSTYTSAETQIVTVASDLNRVDDIRTCHIKTGDETNIVFGDKPVYRTQQFQTTFHGVPTQLKANTSCDSAGEPSCQVQTPSANATSVSPGFDKTVVSQPTVNIPQVSISGDQYVTNEPHVPGSSIPPERSPAHVSNQVCSTTDIRASSVPSSHHFANTLDPRGQNPASNVIADTNSSQEQGTKPDNQAIDLSFGSVDSIDYSDYKKEVGSSSVAQIDDRESPEVQSGKIQTDVDTITNGASSIVVSEPVETAENTKEDPVAVPAAPVKKSWAGLFDGVKSTGITYNVTAQSQPVAGFPKLGEEDNTKDSEAEKPWPVQPSQPIPVSEDIAAWQLGELLINYKLCHRQVSLQPRGLINRGNWCYINATLQALLACPPFYHLIKSIPSYTKEQRNGTSTPVLDSMVEFVSNFSQLQHKPGMRTSTKPTDVRQGPSFEPKNVYEMLQVIHYDSTFKQGRQEDAEEFLSCILNCMHDEMLAALKLVKSDNKAIENNNTVDRKGSVDLDGTAVVGGQDMTLDDEDPESWEQVGPKNKSVVTRSTEFDHTPVSDIFCGKIRSALHQAGSKESATLQPFFTLQLDIQSEKVWTLRDALDAFASRESLQGYTSDTTKAEIEATRKITLEELPPVLVLHIKCFVYDKTGGCQKVIKKVEFGTDLPLGKELLSPNVKAKYHQGQRSYKLFAVVNHYGEKAVGGHYNTDIYHPGYGGWVRMDDGLVKSVTLQQVLKFTPPKMPYLLYYRRCDLL